MGYFLLGTLILAASVGGLIFSLPTGGQMKSYLNNGVDTWVAVAITVGIGLGIGGIVVGIFELIG